MSKVLVLKGWVPGRMGSRSGDGASHQLRSHRLKWRDQWRPPEKVKYRKEQPGIVREQWTPQASECHKQNNQMDATRHEWAQIVGEQIGHQVVRNRPTQAEKRKGWSKIKSKSHIARTLEAFWGLCFLFWVSHQRDLGDVIWLTFEQYLCGYWLGTQEGTDMIREGKRCFEEVIYWNMWLVILEIEWKLAG